VCVLALPTVNESNVFTARNIAMLLESIPCEGATLILGQESNAMHKKT
jgi:hypothetical protein